MSDKIGGIKEIDGINISDIDKSNRKEWSDSLCDKLEENIEPIVDSFVDSANRNHTNVTVVAELDHTENFRGFEIQYSLKSVGQKIRSELEDDKYASANVVDNIISPPELIEDNIYEGYYYFITVKYP